MSTIKKGLLSFGLITSVLTLAAHAEVPVCRVADPTGTPLNVRTVPSGKTIVETLKNGTRVTILDTKKNWAYIALLPEEDETAVGDKLVVPTGWVYREYLDCSARRKASDPDDWLIVKDLATNTCVVSAKTPNNKNLVIVTSFKAFMTGGKAMKQIVVAECGCEKEDCHLALPTK
jgi:hypothetical protein